MLFAEICMQAELPPGVINILTGAGKTGSLVTLICDSGDRYANTYYSDEWLAANGLDPSPFEPAIEDFLASGKLALQFEESWG